MSSSQPYDSVVEARLASEQKYRLLFDSIDEGFCIIQVIFDKNESPVDYRFLEVNPAFVRQTGLDKATGKRMLELAPTHETHWFELYGQIALTGEPKRFENRAAALDDRWYDVYAFRIGEPHLRLVGVLFNDVSGRKRTDEALRASEERFRLFVENVHEYALVQTDLLGRVISWNPGAERLFGYSAAEVLGQSLSHLLIPEEQGVRGFEQELTSSERYEDARWLIRQSGDLFWGRWVAEPVLAEDGCARAVAWILRDETDRKRAEQNREHLMLELERSNNELARFAHAVAHDLRAPVRTIRGFSQLLALRISGKLEPKETQLLSTVTEAAGQMSQLIESLLQYAQVGQGRLRREPVDAGNLVGAAQVKLASAIADSQACIEWESLPTIEGDRIQLEQLFQNLIDNAIRYRLPDEKPVIRIQGEQIAGGWQFAVSDNGQGVPHKSQEAIFEPLTRLHGSDAPGTGLGLALCKTIVERHGGRIWVESKGSGFGSTFRFVLADMAP